MRMKVMTFAVVLQLVGGLVAPLMAQSLGEVANGEAARRKAINSPTKRISNSDLKPVLSPESAATPAPATTGASGDAAKTDGAKTDAAKPADGAAPAAGAVKDQAYWSGRMKAGETQL